jgi:hypothetical protein
VLVLCARKEAKYEKDRAAKARKRQQKLALQKPGDAPAAAGASQFLSFFGFLNHTNLLAARVYEVHLEMA